jgi:hypothetical protein
VDEDGNVCVDLGKGEICNSGLTEDEFSRLWSAMLLKKKSMPGKKGNPIKCVKASATSCKLGAKIAKLSDPLIRRMWTLAVDSVRNRARLAKVSKLDCGQRLPRVLYLPARDRRACNASQTQEVRTLMHATEDLEERARLAQTDPTLKKEAKVSKLDCGQRLPRVLYLPARDRRACNASQTREVRTLMHATEDPVERARLAQTDPTLKREAKAKIDKEKLLYGGWTAAEFILLMMSGKMSSVAAEPAEASVLTSKMNQDQQNQLKLLEAQASESREKRKDNQHAVMAEMEKCACTQADALNKTVALLHSAEAAVAIALVDKHKARDTKLVAHSMMATNRTSNNHMVSSGTAVLSSLLSADSIPSVCGRKRWLSTEG